MAKKPVIAQIQKYVGETHDHTGLVEAVYDPIENSVVFRDHRRNEVSIDPASLHRMIDDLTIFAGLLAHIGVKTKGA